MKKESKAGTKGNRARGEDAAVIAIYCPTWRHETELRSQITLTFQACQREPLRSSSREVSPPLSTRAPTNRTSVGRQAPSRAIPAGEGVRKWVRHGLNQSVIWKIQSWAVKGYGFK